MISKSTVVVPTVGAASCATPGASAAGTAGSTSTWPTSTRAAPARAAATRSSASSRFVKGSRGGGQLPADSCTWHFASSWAFIARIFRFHFGAIFQAAEAARLSVASAEAPSCAAASSASFGAVATTATARVSPVSSRTRDAVDDIVKFAARNRIVRALFALIHANQADPVDVAFHNVERF